MNTDSDTRGPASESNETADRKPQELSASVAPRRTTTRIALGSVVALLLLAAAASYFVDRRDGTQVAMPPARESPPAATPTRPPEAAERPASPTAPAPSIAPSPGPSSEPTGPRQSATPVQPPAAVPPREPRVATPAPEPQAAPSTTTPQEQTSATQPSMRNQAAALPDQPAAAPKVETILVVKRGPANIRSTPGKGGRVIGSAAKDATLKELSRSGNWVEVETESGIGWIAATLLAPRAPQSQ